MNLFLYQNENYEIKIIRKKNKNTYIRVKNGCIIVTTSYFMPSKKIDQMLKLSRESIEKMIKREREQQQKKEQFFLLGNPYQIIFDPSIKNVFFEKSNLFCSDLTMLSNFLDQNIKKIFPKHLAHWQETIEKEENIPQASLLIRKMKSRWGVCNIKTCRITLNSELIHYSEDCLDYVIIHELCHFLEPNHSPRFWHYVAKYCPDYKEKRKKLRS